MHNVNVEFFEKAYLHQSTALLRDHLDIFSENDIEQFKQDLHEYLASHHHTINHGLTFVVVVNKIVYGLVMFQKDLSSHNSFHIHWLVVANSQQNKGYGTHLLKEAFKRIKEKGGRHVYLETSNERHNDHAKKFYENLGFKKIGVLPDYFDPPVKIPRKLEDGILYHKEL